MERYVQIGSKCVGRNHLPYLVAEIGVNHNGSIQEAMFLIGKAKEMGADAVKFQKRTPELCVPRSEWDKPRLTPWGETMAYIDYKRQMEFGKEEYDRIALACKNLGLQWFASVWDEPSVEFMEQYDPPAYKIGSPSLTDRPLIQKVLATGRPIVLSTGMSTTGEIDEAWTQCYLGNAQARLILLHCVSEYPCLPENMELRVIQTLQRYPLVVGYSGHEQGTQFVAAQVALGASLLERHFTRDRSQPGTDHKASLEPREFEEMRRIADATWKAMGKGPRIVHEAETQNALKLRRTLFSEAAHATQ